MFSKDQRNRLYEIIFEADTPAGKLFDVVLLWAIILSVAAVILDSDAGIRENYGIYLRTAEWVFTILFTVEYVLRLMTVKSPAHYARSFFGIVDLISVIPTYLSLFITGSQYLLVIRAVRLLRVFSVLKLARYLKESEQLMWAMKASSAKITVFIGGVVISVVIVGTVMHLVEADTPGFDSIFSSMYWAIVTMTTVGYGDIVPATSLGKFIASCLMIMGYGIIAVPTGIVSAELSNVKRSVAASLTCGACGAVLKSGESKHCHNCGQAHHPFTQE